MDRRVLAALGAGVVAGVGLGMLLSSSPGSAAAPSELNVEAKAPEASSAEASSTTTGAVVDPASLAPGKPVDTAGVLVPGRGERTVEVDVVDHRATITPPSCKLTALTPPSHHPHHPPATRHPPKQWP